MVLVLLPAGLGACRERVDRAQCDELLGRFAELVVREKMPKADADVVKKEQAREREEAARDDNFKNCTTELRASEYRCAMAAPTADAFIKCLE
jgi:hypothetical protein